MTGKRTALLIAWIAGLATCLLGYVMVPLVLMMAIIWKSIALACVICSAVALCALGQWMMEQSANALRALKRVAP